MSTESQMNMFDENINIVYYCFHQLNKTEFILRCEEDIIQEGLTALWAAVLNYDKSVCDKFSSYAFPCVRNAMLSWIKNNATYRHCSMEEKINDDSMDDYDVCLKDILSTECDFDSLEDLKNDLINDYEKWLTKRHRCNNTVQMKLSRAKIILQELLTNVNMPMKNIEKKYNIHRTIISNIVGELRYMLKDEYPTFYEQKRRRSVQE